MALKTNYQNDVFEGKRKYIMTANNDGTVSFTDTTTYLTRGDSYGASEVNATNTVINNIETFVGKKLATKSLAANATSLTFTDSSITTSSTIEVFTDKWLVSPITITTSAGSCTMTFKAQSTKTDVYIIVR